MKLSPQHKVLDTYYQRLASLRQLDVKHEMGLRGAFQEVLSSLAPSVGWTLVPEQTLPNGKRPDGTLRDGFLARGYWEAKDSGDDLETEIRKKIAAGYPTTNCIYEDTRTAILYQQGRRVDRYDLGQRRELADLLEQFFSYTEPPIEEFHKAVGEFKDRIPDLAGRVLEHIRRERAENQTFRRAFEAFHALCQSALNPQISLAAIEEMLVQHLLTERLFRTIFDNPNFTRKNVIAAEIERVIDDLTSRAFNRAEFLKSLDRFYEAIERSARTIADWSEKQAFLNTVYERFFQGVRRVGAYEIPV